MGEKNAVIEALGKILAQADMIHIPIGQRTYALSDPNLPVRKAGAFIKTQINLLVKDAAEAAENAGE